MTQRSPSYYPFEHQLPTSLELVKILSPEEAMVEEQDLSIITGSEGYDDSLISVSEFTDYLKADLSSEESHYEGRIFWSFWRSDKYQPSEYEEKIKSVLVGLKYYALVQFWAPKVDDGGHHYLTTSDMPFGVGSLRKGYCWYRKQCMDHRYSAEEGSKEEKLGAVGRVYLNQHRESSPDLRLYSIEEFPLRDYAGRCGLRKYLALPVFDLLKNECCGVLEVLSFDTPIWEDDFLTLNQRLQAADLRSSHIHFFPIRRDLLGIILPPKYKEQPESEISKMLELAIKAVPQLHLAQVWVPCEQCAIMSNNSYCMERAAFITADNETVNSFENINPDMFDYLQACEFHNLQIGKGIARALMPLHSKSGICRSLCDISISENPMAHYAQRARLSLWFAVSLESVHNDIYVIEFFLQSNCREDAYCDSSRHLLLRVMERDLKSYKFELGGEVVEEVVVELRQSTEHVQAKNCQLSEMEFAKYLQTADLCCLRRSEEFLHGWVSCSPAREESYEHDVISNSSLVLNLMMKDQRIKRLMNGIASKLCYESYSLVQFWAPKMEEDDDRCYLETSEQPYALGCLGKGLALFRKQCMEHRYFVDVEEELGPPGRVFRSRHPEITPDLRLYSTREFSLRNHAVNCSLRKYCALPVFDLHQHQCLGVLEVLEFGEPITFEDIGEALEAANLSSAHIDFNPIFLASRLPANIAECRKQAFTEIKEALRLVTEIPQLYKADVWVPCGQCASVDGNLSCMELIISTESGWEIWLPTTNVYRHVQTNKGIAGMLLASKNKACFVRNSCDFSIAEQPQAHYAARARLDVCFAICLQSSHTGDLLYVVEFFLNQGPATHAYLRFFLNFLLPMMKQKLNSFKIASGKQLGEELVVEVIQFSEASKLTSPKLHLPNIFPLEFETVQYGQKEHQHTKYESAACVSDGMDSDTSVAQATRCSTAAESSKKEDAAKKKGRGKRKTGPGRLTLEDLKAHFGKRLEDAEEALKVGRSTIKRACRFYGIKRWPKHKNNSSLFETESANESAPDSQQNMWRPSSSSNLPPLDMSLHQNVPQTDSEITQYRSVQSEPEKVIIKAKFQDDTIKFHLCLSSGMDKLVEEVATGLNLKVGSFKLKYLDEDNEEILLARDAHLQLCLESATARGTFIQLFVQLISK